MDKSVVSSFSFVVSHVTKEKGDIILIDTFKTKLFLWDAYSIRSTVIAEKV